MTDARALALPADYKDLLDALKERVRHARQTALRTVNTQLIELYWSIGNTVLERQKVEQWGSGVMGRLAEDLRAEFPEMKGLLDGTASTCGPLPPHGRTQLCNRPLHNCRGVMSRFFWTRQTLESIEIGTLAPQLSTDGPATYC